MHNFILFMWRSRKMQMSSLSSPFSFFLGFPFLTVSPKISCRHCSFQHKVQMLKVEKKQNQFFNEILWGKAEKGKIFQVGCTGFCAMTYVLFSGSLFKALTKHESSMYRTVCLSLLPAGSSSQSKFRKYILWLH